MVSFRTGTISVTVEMKVSPIYLCPTCGTAVARNQRFCSACGVRLNALAQATTVTRPPDRCLNFLTSSTTPASAGAVLAQRYRIVSLLGRGGMGEVYCGDDLLLRQPVAMKFLPAYATASEPALSRFLDEDELRGNYHTRMSVVCMTSARPRVSRSSRWKMSMGKTSLVC